ncbi:PREDICTED: uncharacterized protein LOC109154157 [Ipomoea nil]|uniref:uncharacterized protein LOC109154157 n=1 Tax=Ipomoea nil TaxID=35883 RepID=UPI000901E4A7|nr:PREDICTED: uncharacterized protein LOC109154157 [Ipomoea nil]
MFVNSSEHTPSATAGVPPTTHPNPLTSAHHFVSLKLTAHNYLFWRTQLIHFLRGQGLLGYVDGTHPCLPAMVETSTTSGEGTSAGTPIAAANPEFAAWVQQDQAILSLLISSLLDKVMYLAVVRTTARAVWESIGTALGSSMRACCLNLLGQFQDLRQGDSTPAEYLGRAQLLVEDLALASHSVSLDEQNLYVFKGLRLEFRAMVASLAVSGNPVTIPQLSDYLQAQVFIFADDYPASGEISGGAPTAMVADRNRRQNGDGFAGQRRGGNGRGRGRGSGNGRGRGQGGGGPRCQICRSHGHTAVYCFRRYTGQPPVQANMAVAGDVGNPAAATDVWFPDTGVSSHVTPDSTVLTQSKEYTSNEQLRIGNGSGLVISHIGCASIPCNSKSLSLSNILYVPDLSVSLLSVPKLTRENNVFVEFHANCFFVKDCHTKKVLLTGPSSGGLYKLSVPCHNFAFITSLASPLTWHRRFGHPHSRALQHALRHCFVLRNKSGLPGLSRRVKWEKLQDFL